MLHHQELATGKYDAYRDSKGGHVARQDDGCMRACMMMMPSVTGVIGSNKLMVKTFVAFDDIDLFVIGLLRMDHPLQPSVDDNRLWDGESFESLIAVMFHAFMRAYWQENLTSLPSLLFTELHHEQTREIRQHESRTTNALHTVMSKTAAGISSAAATIRSAAYRPVPQANNLDDFGIPTDKW